MRFAVDVECRGVGVGAEPHGARLVSGRTYWHSLVHIDAVVVQVLLETELTQHPLQLPPEPLEALDVVVLIECEVDRVVVSEGDAVVWCGQVLTAQPEVDAVLGDLAERLSRRDLPGPVWCV